MGRRKDQWPASERSYLQALAQHYKAHGYVATLREYKLTPSEFYNVVRGGFPDSYSKFLEISIEELDELTPLTPGARYPLGAWSNQDTVRNALLRALFTIRGFKAAYNRPAGKARLHELGRLIKRNVLGYQAKEKRQNGGLAFFQELGLAGLLALPRPEVGLNKSASLAEALNLAVPGIISRDDSELIHPAAVERHRYTVTEKAEEEIFSVLDDLGKGAVRRARKRGSVKLTAKLLREELLKYESPKLQSRGAYALLRDKTLTRALRACTQESKNGGEPRLVQLLNRYLPGLVDPSNADALHPAELGKGYWQNQDHVEFELNQLLDGLGKGAFGRAKKRSDIGTMAQLFRQEVLGYRSPHSQRRGVYQFFVDHGLGGLLSSGRGRMAAEPKRNNIKKGAVAKKGRAKPATRQTARTLVEQTVPGLIDKRNPAALHPDEFRRGPRSL